MNRSLLMQVYHLSPGLSRDSSVRTHDWVSPFAMFRITIFIPRRWWIILDQGSSPGKTDSSDRLRPWVTKDRVVLYRNSVIIHAGFADEEAQPSWFELRGSSMELGVKSIGRSREPLMLKFGAVQVRILSPAQLIVGLAVPLALKFVLNVRLY